MKLLKAIHQNLSEKGIIETNGYWVFSIAFVFIMLIVCATEFTKYKIEHGKAFVLEGDTNRIYKCIKLNIKE